MALTPAIALTITEDIPNGLSVVLADSDSPHGFPRDKNVYSGGGTLEHEAIFLPGKREPIFQVQQPRFRDLVFDGHFRDHLAAQDAGANQPTHARDTRDAIEAIRLRANPLSILWGDDRWTGILKEAEFNVEGQHDIAYVLTFAVATVASVPAEPQPEGVPQANADLMAAIAGDLAQRRAEWAALKVRATVLFTISTVLTALDNAAQAITDASTAVAAVDAAPATAVLAMSQRASSLCGLAQVKAVALASAAAAKRARDVSPEQDPALAVGYYQAQYNTTVTCAEASDSLRAVRADLRSRTRTTTRVYVVQPGDTLESIARTQLGDASRAGDLGVRADQLAPGSRVRIPEAA